MLRRDPAVNELMVQGCLFMKPGARDLHVRALEVFDRIIAMQPSFAEVRAP